MTQLLNYSIRLWTNRQLLKEPLRVDFLALVFVLYSVCFIAMNESCNNDENKDSQLYATDEIVRPRRAPIRNKRRLSYIPINEHEKENVNTTVNGLSKESEFSLNDFSPLLIKPESNTGIMRLRFQSSNNFGEATEDAKVSVASGAAEITEAAMENSCPSHVGNMNKALSADRGPLLSKLMEEPLKKRRRVKSKNKEMECEWDNIFGSGQSKERFRNEKNPSFHSRIKVSSAINSIKSTSSKIMSALKTSSQSSSLADKGRPLSSFLQPGVTFNSFI